MRDRPDEWIQILDELCAGSHVAFLKLNGLITAFLTKLRAYDFQDEWDDLRQEVVLSLIVNVQAGRLHDPQALLAYVQIITRNKVLDRIKRSVSHREKEVLPLDASLDGPLALRTLPTDDGVTDLRTALGDLPRQQQQVLLGVYVEGKTYDTVSAETGIPLGTLKRRLRDGLAVLRRRLQGAG
jgi:RNA polymerase sigma-70 factor, ECF subfamily